AIDAGAYRRGPRRSPGDAGRVDAGRRAVAPARRLGDVELTVGAARARSIRAAAAPGAVGSRAGAVGLAVRATGAGRARVGIEVRAGRRVRELALELLVVANGAPWSGGVESDRDDHALQVLGAWACYFGTARIVLPDDEAVDLPLHVSAGELSGTRV